MDDLSLEDAKQLISFYRQKISDIELQYLQLQLKYNKIFLNIEKENIKTKNK